MANTTKRTVCSPLQGLYPDYEVSCNVILFLEVRLKANYIQRQYLHAHIEFISTIRAIHLGGMVENVQLPGLKRRLSAVIGH